MAKFRPRFRRFRRSFRRFRSYRPFRRFRRFYPRKNNSLLWVGILAGAFFLFKDKILGFFGKTA